MSAEQDKAVVRRFVEEVMNEGDLEAADELIAPDHVNHDPTAPDVPPGPEGVKQLIAMYRAAFPDIHFHTGEMFAIEGRVAHRWTFTGTHEGEMMGVEPTGRQVEVSGVEITRSLPEEHLLALHRRSSGMALALTCTKHTSDGPGGLMATNVPTHPSPSSSNVQPLQAVGPSSPPPARDHPASSSCAE